MGGEDARRASLACVGYTAAGFGGLFGEEARDFARLCPEFAMTGSQATGRTEFIRAGGIDTA